MHTSTLLLVALASIMVTFSTAKPLDRQNSVADVPTFGSQGVHGDFHQKRKMRKRFSPGNSGTKQGAYGSSNVSPNSAPASVAKSGGGGGLGGGITDGLPLVGGGSGGIPLVGGATGGGAGGGIPLVGDLL